MSFAPLQTNSRSVFGGEVMFIVKTAGFPREYQTIDDFPEHC